MIITTSIHGTKRGYLWQGGQAEKSFNESRKNKETLRHLVTRVTKDGDFDGNTKILLDSYIRVTVYKKNVMVTRKFYIDDYLSMFESIKDSIDLDYPRW